MFCFVTYYFFFLLFFILSFCTCLYCWTWMWLYSRAFFFSSNFQFYHLTQQCTLTFAFIHPLSFHIYTYIFAEIWLFFNVFPSLWVDIFNISNISKSTDFGSCLWSKFKQLYILMLCRGSMYTLYNVLKNQQNQFFFYSKK